MAKSTDKPETTATEQKPPETTLAPPATAAEAKPETAQDRLRAAMDRERKRETELLEEQQVRAALRAEAKEKARERARLAEGRYRVTLGDLTGEYEARDANEAWALFCDAHKSWPSPKYSQRKIEKIEPAPVAA